MDTQPDTKRARLDDVNATQEEAERMVVEPEAVEGATSGATAGDAIDVDATSSAPDVDELVDAVVETETDADVADVSEEAKAEIADAPQPTGPTMRIGKKLARGEGGFKENPYTFLAPDDSVLVSCLCVLFPSAFIYTLPAT